ncbi:MAG: sulfatase [Polyangiaceae bacterium]|nr:sulfatase [Polyangiaceae bacterium]
MNSRRLGAVNASLLSWIALAAVNAVFVAMLSRKGVSIGTRAFHHAYDAGQLLFAGVLSAASVALWQRIAPTRRFAADVALAALAGLVAFLIVSDDLANFAQRMSDETLAPYVLAALLIGLAVSLPIVARLGAFLGRSRARYAGIAAAIGLAVLNNLVLKNDYRGVHLFVSLAAAVLLTHCLAETVLPTPIAHRPKSLGLAAHGVVTLVGACAVIIPPRADVSSELPRVNGAVVAPLTSRIRQALRSASTDVPAEWEPWFESREKHPPIPSTGADILPKDSIVLLVTVDSMRPNLFDDEKRRAQLPRLFELRSRSVDFAMTRSPGARTLPTWGAVHTGKHYSGLFWTGVNIGKDRSTRFPTLLEKAGVKCVNFVSYSALNSKNLKGGYSEEVPFKPKAGQDYPLSEQVIPAILERLDKHTGGPLFIFAHLMDPHYPYNAAGTKGSAFDRYLREVALADKSIGALWDGVAERGLLDRTTFIVAADHGEAFGQHNTPYHTITVYEELIRVPLFVRIPGAAPRRVQDPVSLLDLGPTLLDLFGVSTPGSFLAESLTPYFRGQSPKLTRPIAAERIYTQGLIVGNHKVVIDREKGTEEIFDLTVDPEETNNLVESLGPQGEKELALLRAFFKTHARR